MLETSVFYRLTINNLAIEAAKISLSRDNQNNDSDPVKIADQLHSHFLKARNHLLQKTKNDILSAIKDETKLNFYH